MAGNCVQDNAPSNNFFFFKNTFLITELLTEMNTAMRMIQVSMWKWNVLKQKQMCTEVHKLHYHIYEAMKLKYSQSVKYAAFSYNSIRPTSELKHFKKPLKNVIIKTSVKHF